MPIRLHDSLTRELRELRRPDPNDPKDVFSFYNCGLTVYAAGHIGNFRTFVINDVLRRLLELEFGQDKVRHVRNLTDVDDKTIRRAREEGRPLTEVTRQWTEKLWADCRALNLLTPHAEPAATRHIREQVDMIDVLMKKGNAYRAPDGSVYFKVSSFPDYGRLSRIHERELQLGTALAGKAYAADADEKEDGSDFALWKAYKPEDGDNAWDSPWGRGRPGWHIECSAMSKKILGDTIDLHTGGVDLLFPHHENEIAQSECCNGVPFARHWYHSEHLLVDGKKMSKSLGNYYTLDDLAKNMGHVDPKKIGMEVRYALMQAHPRKQQNFTLDSVSGAFEALLRLRIFYVGLKTFGTEEARNAPASIRFEGVIRALSDDLNFPAAFGALFTEVNRKEEAQPGDLLSFERAMFALGLELDEVIPPKLEVPAVIAALAKKRWAAKQAKDFSTADAIRKEITAAGWSMLEGKDLTKDDYTLKPLKK